ncbi:MAG: crotonase/enoyl-CoA hydratase family protein [Pseudomonadota bacterium]
MVLEIEDDARGVRTLWLNRPEVHNAMSADMMDALHTAVSELEPGGPVRVLILAGRGKSFCAGGDLGWMRAQIGATPEARAAEAHRLSSMLLAMHNLDIPIIGRIHGNAFGGGVGLTAICDVAVGVEGRSMGLTETRLGLIPATIGPYVAARMGPKLRSVFMSSRVFSTEEGRELGLLGRVVPEEELDPAIEREVAPYLSCAPGAVAAAKRQARDLGPRIDATAMDAALAALVSRWESEETAEGLAAFFEKRAPNWSVGGT